MTVKQAFAFSMKEFNGEIKNLSSYYEKNPEHTKNQALINSLGETTAILRESAEMLLERNEKLNIIAQKSRNLLSTSNDLRSSVCTCLIYLGDLY
jgi:hypothetical protein